MRKQQKNRAAKKAVNKKSPRKNIPNVGQFVKSNSLTDIKLDKITQIHPDLPLKISFAQSVRNPRLELKTMRLDEFIKLLANTKRDTTTHAEFRAMDAEGMLRHKDVGGFVAGVFRENLRRKLNLLSRSCITLDADGFADNTALQNALTRIKKLGIACMAYSTRKHTINKPRVRFVFFLDKELDVDEYEAVSRMLAEHIDPKFVKDGVFDPVSFNGAQQMFLPSTDRDAVFFARYIDGKLTSTSQLKSAYEVKKQLEIEQEEADKKQNIPAWKDARNWKRTYREMDKDNKEKHKCDYRPSAKDNIVGRFCTVYSIHDAIAKFLPNVFTRVSRDRYTYAGATSYAGAVVYGGEWLHDYHATDPYCGKNLNAFDLVRLHKFGKLDENCQAENVTELPSYKAMLDLCDKDKDVRAVTRLRELRGRLPKEIIADMHEDYTWLNDLQYVNQETMTRVKSTADNYTQILCNDPRFKGCLAFDEMSHSVVFTRRMFWEVQPRFQMQYEEGDTMELDRIIERDYGISNPRKLWAGAMAAAKKKSFNAMKEYMGHEEWDRTPRVDTILCDMLGAEDTEYTRKVGQYILAGGWRRINEPGCEMQNIPVLCDKHGGTGKTQFIKLLGGPYYALAEGKLSKQDLTQVLQMGVFIELGELEVYKNSSRAANKNITTNVDYVRMPYAHHAQKFPRHCMLIGTHNGQKFLEDPTGNRRYLPVDCTGKPDTHKINVYAPNALAYMRQVWAELRVRYERGEFDELLQATTLELISMKEQEAHEIERPETGIIEAYLEEKKPQEWHNWREEQKRAYIESGVETKEGVSIEMACSPELWCLLFDGTLRNFDRRQINRIEEACSQLRGWHWTKEKVRCGRYGLQRVLVRNRAA